MAKRTKRVRQQEKPAKTPHYEEATIEISSGHRSGMVKTCLAFLGIMGLLHAALWRYSLEGEILWGSTTVKIVSYLLSMVGVANVATQNTITLRFSKWLVLPECTGVNAVILFVSFVIAYSSTFKAKFLALIVGVPLLLAANISRLVALGVVTEHWPVYAHVFHDYVWETIFLLFIITLWCTWIRTVVSREAKL